MVSRGIMIGKSTINVGLGDLSAEENGRVRECVDLVEKIIACEGAPQAVGLVSGAFVFLSSLTYIIADGAFQSSYRFDSDMAFSCVLVMISLFAGLLAGVGSAGSVRRSVTPMVLRLSSNMRVSVRCYTFVTECKAVSLYLTAVMARCPAAEMVQASHSSPG